MEERAAIATLIFAQLGGVDEERVAGSEQRVRAEAAARQLQRILVGEQESELRILGAQILAELVAKILRRIALGEHRRRRAAVNGPVVARHEHLHLAARGLFEHGEERGASEPLLRELAQRDLVAGNLVQDRRFGSAVCEQIYEVEYERGDSFRTDDACDAPLDVVALGGRRNLFVADRDGRAELGQLRFQQLSLVCVQGLVFALAPPVREAGRDLAGKEAAEQGIPRIRRRRGQDAEVVRRLDLEQRRDDRLQSAPLIESQTVDYDEHCVARTLQHREQKLTNDVDGQRRAAAAEIAQPSRIGRFQVQRELASEVGI